MALDQHDRLDLRLHTEAFTGATCGFLNLRTGQAEYCGYDCPTLKTRMLAGEDPGVPTNDWYGPPKDMEPYDHRP